MSGFILDYGTWSNDHVSLDLQNDLAQVDFISGEPSWSGTVDQFEARFPTIVNEMVANGVLRRKDESKPAPKAVYTLNPQSETEPLPTEMQFTQTEDWAYVDTILHPLTQEPIVEAGEVMSVWSFAALHRAGCDAIRVTRA